MLVTSNMSSSATEGWKASTFSSCLIKFLDLFEMKTQKSVVKFAAAYVFFVDTPPEFLDAYFNYLAPSSLSYLSFQKPPSTSEENPVLISELAKGCFSWPFFASEFPN